MYYAVGSINSTAAENTLHQPYSAPSSNVFSQNLNSFFDIVIFLSQVTQISIEILWVLPSSELQKYISIHDSFAQTHADIPTVNSSASEFICTNILQTEPINMFC